MVLQSLERFASGFSRCFRRPVCRRSLPRAVRQARAVSVTVPLAVLAVCVAQFDLLGFVALRPSFSSRLSSSSSSVGRRAAGDGFSYGAKKNVAKGFSGSADSSKQSGDAKTNSEDSSEEETSTKLAKNENAGKSKALTKTKLSDLRDKTLALRQKREAELDEYEEGRAMIAKYGPKVAVMPQKVAERSAKRGMVIGGSFYGVMLAVVAVGIILYKTQEVIIPPPLMAFITLSLLALSILGSSYGMMSSSWDEDREGSLFGTEEFSKNVGLIGDGFRKLAMQDEYEKAIVQRRDRAKLLEAKEEKKKELLTE